MATYLNKTIETKQDCPACGEYLTITALNTASCNRSKCYEKLFDLNGVWVTHDTWFEDYIIPMMEKDLAENAGA